MPHRPTVGGPQRPTTLTTTGDEAPIGVDPDDVLFAWRLDDARRGARQRAYRIVVTGPTSGRTTGRVVWDSGPVNSDDQAFVTYGGPSLAPATRYRWTVRTADESGRWSPSGAPATFITGLRSTDWTASWLRPGPVDIRRGDLHLSAQEVVACRPAPWPGPSPTWPPPTASSFGSTARSCRRARASVSPTSSTCRRPTSPPR